MKYILLLSILLVTSCAANKPTPFTTTDKTVYMKGCEELKEEVHYKNQTLPKNEQIEADC